LLAIPDGFRTPVRATTRSRRIDATSRPRLLLRSMDDNNRKD